jgi:hypothetical protein
MPNECEHKWVHLSTNCRKERSAYLNAEKCYDGNIEDLRSEKLFIGIQITEMSYMLGDLIASVWEKMKN